MANRKPLSKRTRFEVFKRDDFRCAYCGASPPDALLHADHIIPVVDGGENKFSNLVTACERCNLGKGPRPLADSAHPLVTPESIEATKERKAQIDRYRKHIREWADAKLAAENDEVAIVAEAFMGKPGFTWQQEGAPEARNQVLGFIRRLGVKRVREAAAISLRREARDQFRYFCGCCWTMIRAGDDDA